MGGNNRTIFYSWPPLYVGHFFTTVLHSYSHSGDPASTSVVHLFVPLATVRVTMNDPAVPVYRSGWAVFVLLYRFWETLAIGEFSCASSFTTGTNVFRDYLFINLASSQCSDIWINITFLISCNCSKLLASGKRFRYFKSLNDTFHYFKSAFHAALNWLVIT